MNSNDLRYIRTEENLKKALLHLLESQNLENISISALCAEARCSRNAFYQHYETKYDLFDAILKSVVGAIKESTMPIRMDQREMGESEIQEFTYKLLKILYGSRGDIISLLNGSEMFIFLLSNSLYEAFMENYSLVTEPGKITDKGRLLTRYFCSGITGFILQWLYEEDISLEEAQRELDRCMHDNLKKMRDLLI